MSLELFLDLFVQYDYWIIFAGILLDNAGLPLPGELLLLAFGALARTGQMDLEGGIVLAAAAAMAGDNLGYWLGRLGGDRLLHGYCRVTLGSGKCLQRAVAFYKLRGAMAVVFGRFVMGVRAFLFPLAGSARMPYTTFLLFDGIGALTWVSVFSLAGYSLGWQIGSINERYAGRLGDPGGGARNGRRDVSAREAQPPLATWEGIAPGVDGFPRGSRPPATLGASIRAIRLDAAGDRVRGRRRE